MTFVPGYPSSGQSLGQTRQPIQTNLDQTFLTFNANHQSNNLPNAGTHTHVDLLAQAADPTTPVGIVSHYSKIVAPGTTEWFFRREGNGAVMQMSAGNPIVGIVGSSYLPGGVTLKWGTSTGPAPIVFAPAFTTLFTIVISPVDTVARPIAITTQSNTGFTPSLAVNTQIFYWMAIGI